MTPPPTAKRTDFRSMPNRASCWWSFDAVTRLFWSSPAGRAEIWVSTPADFSPCSTRRAYLRQLRSVRTNARASPDPRTPSADGFHPSAPGPTTIRDESSGISLTAAE